MCCGSRCGPAGQQNLEGDPEIWAEGQSFAVEVLGVCSATKLEGQPRLRNLVISACLHNCIRVTSLVLEHGTTAPIHALKIGGCDGTSRA